MAAAASNPSNWTPPEAIAAWLGGTGIRRKFQDPLLVEKMIKEEEKQQQEEQKAEDGGYYSYGSPSSIEDILNLTQQAENQPPIDPATGTLAKFKKGGKVMSSALMAATGGHIADQHHPEYDGTTPVFRTGGKSNHVQGPGDGQSDDIPAMLADGEWVMDADSVSQLGNGSNKAGAAILDAMREALRAHKRSAPTDKIPPKSKSPLQYIKEGMKMKGLK